MNNGRLFDIADELGFTGGLIPELNNYYREDRYYHNDIHILKMLNFVDDHYHPYLYLAHEKRLLKVAILFHDIIYFPGAKTNEYDSWIVCERACKDNNIYCDTQNLAILKDLIMATKDHDYHKVKTELEKAIIMADLQGFAIPDFQKVWNNNYAIFKEFQQYEWVDFKKAQMEFLLNFKVKIESFMPNIAKKNIEDILAVMEVWQPKIAIYPGSFNPFHVGHLNILNKAERIFDKVIIARGNNPEKDNEILPLPKALSNYQVDIFDGLLTDYIATKPYPVTVIRGLRNTTDMAYEQNQYRWLQDLNHEINVVSLFCDKEYEHISSRGIRLMKQFGKQAKYLVR